MAKGKAAGKRPRDEWKDGEELDEEAEQRLHDLQEVYAATTPPEVLWDIAFLAVDRDEAFEMVDDRSKIEQKKEEYITAKKVQFCRSSDRVKTGTTATNKALAPTAPAPATTPAPATKSTKSAKRARRRR